MQNLGLFLVESGNDDARRFETSLFGPTFYHFGTTSPVTWNLYLGEIIGESDDFSQTINLIDSETLTNLWGLSAVYKVNDQILQTPPSVTLQCPSANSTLASAVSSIEVYVYDKNKPFSQPLAIYNLTGYIYNFTPQANFTVKSVNNDSTLSDTLSFYGEGHKQRFQLSATSNLGDIGIDVKANWTIKRTDDGGTISVNDSEEASLSAYLDVPTVIGDYPSYKITLRIYSDDGFLPLDGPTHFYRFDSNDFSIIPIKYDFWTDVPDNTANDAQTIDVIPYPEVKPQNSFFTSTLSGTTDLPYQGNIKLFTSSGNLEFNYDSNLLTLHSQDAKGILHIKNIVNGSQDWEATIEVPTLHDPQSKAVSATFSDWSLRYHDVKLIPFTCFFNVSSVITQTFYVQNYVSIDNADWQRKPIKLKVGEISATIVPTSKVALYTPTPVALLNQKVKFECLNTFLTNTDPLTVTFDDATASPSAVFFSSNEYFHVQFSKPGIKNAEIKIKNNDEIITTKLSNIVNIVSYYDQIEPSSFFDYQETALLLPYPYKPKIAPNEFGTAEILNHVAEVFQSNLEFLLKRAKAYDPRGTQYHGWLGNEPSFILPPPEDDEIVILQPYTWEDLECPGERYIVWNDLKCGSNDPSSNKINYTWVFHECSTQQTKTTDCIQKYCISWKWKNLRNTNKNFIVRWKDTKFDEPMAKKWAFEPCESAEFATDCEIGYWHVKQPLLDFNVNELQSCEKNTTCKIVGIGTLQKGAYIVVARNTEIAVFSDSYSQMISKQPILLDKAYTINGLDILAKVEGIAVNSFDKIFVLDSLLNKVGVWEFVKDKTSERKVLRNINSWGGFGGRNDQNGFYKPKHIHIDQKDRVYVTDRGNACIKVFTAGGNWIKTIYNPIFEAENLVGCSIDSNEVFHVVTETKAFMVNEKGEIFKIYFTTEASKPIIGIDANFTRTCLYIQQENEIIKFYNNGERAYAIPQEIACLDNKQVVFNGRVTHDINRNLYIASTNRILKYIDRMLLFNNRGDFLGDKFWSLEEIQINKNETVSDWPLIRMFHRIWDNIEIVRGILHYRNNKYEKAIWTKNDLLLGQNEIVGNAVINRMIGFLWENFQTLVKYFEREV